MKLTIVTVNRNNSKGLRKTMESVLSQSFKDYEYIILDGASTDDSVEVIKSLSVPSVVWKSEPDKGVYDAMNKALLMAGGEWVCFMNSGDCFHSASVLSEIFDAHDRELSGADVIYGDTMNTFSWGNIIERPDGLKKMDRRMAFCHQSSFVRTSQARSIMFDMRYKIAADYNMFYKLYKDGANFIYYPIVIADYEAEDGMSSVNIGRREKDYALISGRYETLSWKTEYIWRMSVLYVKRFAKYVVPQSLLSSYRKGKVNA